MNLTLFENKNINEKYYYFKHNSGLRVYVFPKELGTSYAAFATKFGSIDSVFKANGRQISLPDGIAHFLEHKMFENEDGTDTFQLYAKTGASANAYTSSDKTVYLFSASENVTQSLEILLDFVTHPYFTKETVDKEQGIIGQEIKMYDDNPGWQLYFGMLTGLYVNNPVRIDTAGTVETISHITPELLFDAYNAFYNLDNMALCVCGKVTPSEVCAVCDKILKHIPAQSIERIYPSEPEGVKSEFVTKHLSVSMPMFSVGIKDNDCPMCGRELLKKRAEYSIILDMIFDKSAPFYTRMYESGLIDSSFSYGYEGHETFAHCEISGCSEDPEKVYAEIKAEIAKYHENCFDKEAFERVKRANYAHILRLFNSTEEISNELIGCVFEDTNILDYPSVMASVTFEDVCARFEKSFSENGFVLSRVLPIEDGKEA